ncbi:MAG: hypothetical protein JXP34_03185 [Planctomycetes bacterium]|nr:hypothetical protein [Planctomycetota bacterium]
MRRRSHLPVFLLLAAIAPAAGAADDAGPPARLRRAESFLGVHFDFHAGTDCTDIGKDLTPEMIEYLIDEVKPDYVQCDCKGHPGRSSYPTKVGNRAGGFVRDPLRIWRDVTARRGVALYLHCSGVWDAAAVEIHPEWARIDENGKRDWRLTSVFGPYADRLLIPQLGELANDYGADGVWVDGECWATERDYGEGILRAFREKTGIESVPRKPEDPGWLEFSAFCREGFRAYLRHYIDEVHRRAPGFQIASNWAFSSMMPEPVSASVDFISGDYSPTDSVNTARFEGRCMVHQGKPWDLMAWSFTRTDGIFSTKTVPQLQREAAVVIALGGGFQAYFPQRRDASIRRWQVPLMADVARFCRARQAYSHKAVPIPQVGLIYSGQAFYRSNRKLFAAWGGELVPLRGVLQSLLDAQDVVDIVMEHHLETRMAEYPLLVWPEWTWIDPTFREKLLAYVRDGGSLLVVGPRAAKLFEEELGAKLIGEPSQKLNGLAFGDRMAGVKSDSQGVELSDRATPFGRIYRSDVRDQNDFAGPFQPAASIAALGKGKIAATYLDLGERYANASTTVARDFLHGLVRALFPDPLVAVDGSHSVDVTAGRVGGRLTVHLVNTAGPHGDATVHIFDDIPPVGPLVVRIRAARPRAVTLQPGDRSVSWTYDEGGIVRALIPRVDIHEILVLE